VKRITVDRYLPVEQDFAVIVPRHTPAADVQDALLYGAGPLATNITLFDVFTGQQIGEDNKSLAYRITFTAPDRALTDAELGKVRKRIEKTLKQRVQGQLRA
jgi:phenylalanyl-tRNA synthetase beta chain